MKKATADCGVTFDHDPHIYKTPRGEVKACDGLTTKRQENIRDTSGKARHLDGGSRVVEEVC